MGRSISLHGHAMAQSKKIGQEETCAPEAPLVWMLLPADLLLDIVARFDLCTFVRCAATCKLLRRDLLSPPFIRCVSRAAPHIVAYLCTGPKKPIALVHPNTPAALSFCHNTLSPFLSRKGAGTLLGEYRPVSSRHGLVILHRLSIQKGPKSDLCVYDPMSGARTFFSNPPTIQTYPYTEQKYALLTEADGIGSSFMLLVFGFYERNVRVHTGSSRGTWGAIKYGSANDFPWWSVTGEPAVLYGGVIHWLARLGQQILSIDFTTGNTGSVKLPSTNCNLNYDGNKVYLATSSDRKLLKLLSIQGFMMFVWLQLPVSAAAGGSSWSLESVIDIEKIRSMDLNITGGPDECIEFEGSGTETGDVVILKVAPRRFHEYTLIVFNLQTKTMHRKKCRLSLLEIDLPSRLQSMKIFS